MPKLLLGTLNESKITEMTSALHEVFKNKVEIVTPADLSIKIEPEETGDTFEKNAQLKAEFYAEISGLPTIADDGGICIEALGGEPGVRSKRWLGYVASDDEIISYTLERLKDIPDHMRTAYFETCVCFFDPRTSNAYCETSTIHGRLANSISRTPMPHYPYRTLFIVDGMNKYYDELTGEESQKINHRRIATVRLARKIKPYLLQ